jgi:carbon-monoxide dehydrogenase small subunit
VRKIVFTLDSRPVEVFVDDSDLLLEVLRDGLGQSDVRYGCGEGICGTCTVLLDGEPVSACLLFAVQIEGRHVETVRGIAPLGGRLHPLQESFLKHGGAQCGYCTPGMILTGVSLAAGSSEPPTREQIREHLSGNLCRCTGYTPIVDAIEEYCRQECAVRGAHRAGGELL